jgi:hypothetical protein
MRDEAKTNRLEIIRFWQEYGTRATCARYGVVSQHLYYWNKVLKEKGEEALNKPYNKRIKRIKLDSGKISSESKGQLEQAKKFLLETGLNFPEAYKKLALWCEENNAFIPPHFEVYALIPKLRKEIGQDTEKKKRRNIPHSKEVEDYLRKLIAETDKGFNDIYRSLALWCAKNDLPLPSSNKAHILFRKLEEELRPGRKVQEQTSQEPVQALFQARRRSKASEKRALTFHGSPMLVSSLLSAHGSILANPTESSSRLSPSGERGAVVHKSCG